MTRLRCLPLVLVVSDDEHNLFPLIPHIIHIIYISENLYLQVEYEYCNYNAKYGLLRDSGTPVP